MKLIGCLLFAMSVGFIASGCGPDNAEVAKNEHLAKDIIKLTNELGDTIESMQKEMAANPAAGIKFVNKIQETSNQLKAKGDEYAKLPPAISKALDRKYQAELKQAETRMKTLEAKMKK